jgi:thiol-disulfide isomerase/thioredoxin
VWRQPMFQIHALDSQNRRESILAIDGPGFAESPFIKKSMLKLSSSSASRWIFAAVLASVTALPGLGAEPPAPLRLRTLEGAPFSLDSLKGRILVLDFWASWCVPCRTSFTFFNSLQSKYAAKGLQVLGLTLEEDDDPVRDFLDDVPAQFTILRDPTGHAGETFGVVAMPTTFLLDTEGRVVARFEGSDPRVHAKLEASAVTLLSGGSLPPDVDVRVSKGLEAAGEIKAWQRGYLADPSMNLDGDPITRMFREHIHASKEGAAGDGGAAGGGCGCN